MRVAARLRAVACDAVGLVAGIAGSSLSTAVLFRAAALNAGAPAGVTGALGRRVSIISASVAAAAGFGGRRVTGVATGKSFAGGYPIVSPLGTIYSTNITPSKTSGIGGYSEAEFSRAVRQGIRKDGAHLYPAMPYDSYAGITDEDMHALEDAAE